MHRTRRLATAITIAVTTFSVLVVGCGSDVVISDEEDDDTPEPRLGEGGGDPGTVEPGICYPCVADCSICADLPGATHRCDEGQPAPSCVQLGGLFDAGDGYYTCWSCL